MSRTALLLSFLAFSSACGDESASPTFTRAESYSFEQVCVAYGYAAAQNLQCQRPVVTSQEIAQARIRQSEFCETVLLAPYRAELGKSLAWDGDRAAGCLNLFLDPACPDLPDDYLERCSMPLEGLKTSGQACGFQEMCAEGAYCANLRGSECRGTCTAYQEAGEACGDGLYCLPPLGCKGGICAPPAELVSGDPCTVSCADGHICDFYTCVVEASAGETCDSDVPCGDGLECVDGVCRPLPLEGETCRFRCADATLRCDIDNVCRMLPTETGAACLEVSARFGVCGNYLACIDGTCRPAPGLGQTCDPETFSCRYGTCNPQTETCKVPPLLGESCDENDFLACGFIGLECVEGRCASAWQYPEDCLLPGSLYPYTL